MNAIVLDINGNLIDYYDRISAIRNKTLSLVKENGEGKEADPLRILRAIRQALKHDFKIDDNLKEQIINKRSLLIDVSPKRIYEELKQIVMFDKVGFYLSNYKKIFFELIPELEKCDGFNQYNDYHIYDMFIIILSKLLNIHQRMFV